MGLFKKEDIIRLSILFYLIIILFSILGSGCARIANSYKLTFEQETYQKMGWMRVIENDPSDISGYQRLKDEMSISRDLQKIVKEKGLPDYLRLKTEFLAFAALELAYCEEGNIYHFSDLKPRTFSSEKTFKEYKDQLPICQVGEILPEIHNSPGLSSYVFKGVKITFPSQGWQLLHKTEKQVGFIKRYEMGLDNTLGFWPVEIYSPAKGRSREQHIKGYFEIEKNKKRPKDLKWVNFKEGERQINGVSYPVMTFKILNENLDSVTDGTFLLVFTDDFQKRQRFYCFMWQQTHPSGKPVPPGAADFDAIVGSLEIL